MSFNLKETNRNNPPISHLKEREVVAVLKKICKSNSVALKSCHISTQLLRTGNSSLYKAILKYGGLHKLNSSYQLGLKLKHKGRTKIEILEVLISIKREGLPITQKSLISQGQAGLLQSMKRYGTLSDFKEELGITVKRKEKWSKEKIIDQYLLLSTQWAQVPSNETLYKNGYNNLKGAIRTHFGGLAKLRDEIGLPNHKKPDHYWTLERTLQDFKSFLKENLVSLNTKSVYGLLEAQGQHALRTAIGKWGGLRKLNMQYKMGLALQGEKWTKKKVIDELKQLHDKQTAITQSNLNKIGRSDLLGAINKYGTLNSLKEEIGLTINRHNYWTDEKILDELRPIVAELGSMPSRTILLALGKGGLKCAIAKRGGHARFSQLLNTQISNYYLAKDGHFLQSSYECIFDNILFKYDIPHDTHKLIAENQNSQYRCDFLIGKTYIEITGFTKRGNQEYHINLEKKIRLYEELKKNYIIIPKEVFTKNIGRIEEKILSILQPLLPVECDLSIAKKIDIRPVVYWADIENVKKELLPLVEKYKRMPMDKEFRAEQRADLLRGIYTYHGNLYEIGKQLSIKVTNKPKGYYSYEKVISIYTTLSKDHGRYLSYKELIQMSLHGMVNVIQKNGGIFTLRQVCDLQFPTCKNI
jgi:hypothetical protein